MKKILTLILTGFMLLATTINVKASTNQIITIGEKTINSYNDTRWQDHLVIYTKNFNRNTMGFELLVEQGTNQVIKRDVLLDLEPNTFIVSGHGVNSTFLMNEVQVGDFAVIEGNKVVFTRDLKLSNLKCIELEENRVDQIIAERKNQLYDIDLTTLPEINNNIQKVKKEFEDLFLTKVPSTYEINSKIKEIQQLINTKYYLTFENYAVEGRALWHRPNASSINELTLANLKKFVKGIYDLGINALFVETFWDGMTTYPSDFLNYQHPRMERYSYSGYTDYIDALIGECHKYGIEVHAWFEVLCGSDFEGNKPSYIKDNWMTTNLTGKVSSFLDPTNEEVQQFLKDLVTEVVTKYDWDGISYDYIRYDTYSTYNGYVDCGFSENAIQKFKQQYNYTGSNLQNDLVSNMTLRKQWHQFKTNAITETVKNLTNTIRNVNKDIIISASPYGYIGDAKTTYMQDIVTWLEKGYLDLVCPMIYTESVDLLQKTADKYNDYTQKVLQYTGISPIYNGADVLTNQQLCAAIKELNISGIALFASQNYLIPNKATMTKEVREAMPNSSHRGHVITPTSNPNDVFNAWKELFLDRYNRIYKDKLSQQEIEIISYFITATDIQMKTPKDIENVLQQIIMLNAYSDTFSNENVKARIVEQTEYIYNILDVAITRHLVRYGYWDMENVEERPNLSTITFKEEIPAGTKTTQQTTTKPTQVPTTQIPTTNPTQGNSGINCEKANVGLTDVLLTISSSIALVGACYYLYKRK